MATIGAIALLSSTCIMQPGIGYQGVVHTYNVVDNKIRVSVLPIKSPQHESSELTSYPEVDGVGNEGKQRGRLFKSSGCNSETNSSPLVRREGEIRNANGVASLHSL